MKIEKLKSIVSKLQEEITALQQKGYQIEVKPYGLGSLSSKLEVNCYHQIL
jgi:hypothetical protein